MSRLILWHHQRMLSEVGQERNACVAVILKGGVRMLHADEYLRRPLYFGAVLRRQDVIHVEPDARAEEQKGCHYCASPLPSGITSPVMT